MKLNDRINEKLTERKWYHRLTAITIVFSLLCAFFVPLDLVKPGIAISIQNTINAAVLATAGNSTWFDDVQETALGDNLSGKIKSISITSGGQTYNGSPIIVDAGNVDPLLFDISLSYNYDGSQLRSSGILDSHCVYYQVPPNTVTINQSYFGKEMIVIDGDWNEEVPSGYYSISESGLIVIRFTDDYISYLENSPNGFKGTIGFKAKVERADNADGDRTFTLEGTTVEVKFDDKELSMSKDGSSSRDATGSYVQWNITINNPNGYIDLSEYNLTDAVAENGTAVDWDDSSKIFDVVVSPADAATKNENGFALSGHAEQVTITYKERAESGKTYKNTATLTKEGKEPIVKEKEIPIENKLEAYKTGTPDYQITGEGEGKKVRWTIDVRNKSGDSLDQTVVTDNNVNFPEDTAIYYFDANNQQVMLNAGYTISGNVITFSGESLPSHVQIIFDTELTDTFDENGQISTTNSVTVRSTKENTKYVSLKAQKVFTGKDEDIPDSASVKLKLYYSTNRNGKSLTAVTASMVDETKRTSFVNPVTLSYNKETSPEPIAQWEGLPSGMNGIPVYYFVQEESVTYGGNTYTLDAESGKFKSGESVCPFQPVYTRNGTNKDGTAIQVNNSEGILIRKQWVNVNGRTVSPPKDVNSTESMAISFEVYGLKSNYRLKLDLTDEQSTLNADNGYKLLLPDPVGLTGVTSQSVKTAIEYTDGKTYNLSYFDNFEIVEKLTPAQIQELYGKFGNLQSTRMINNGTGVLELINTDLRSDTVDVEVEKKWDDNNKNHAGDSVAVTLVQSTNSSLTSDDLNNLAKDNIIAKDYRVGSDIRSTSHAVVGLKNAAIPITFDDSDDENSIYDVSFKDDGWNYSISGNVVTVAGHAVGKTVMTVTFEDGSEQQRIISVIDSYSATLNSANNWKAEWKDLPAVADDGGSYYYYVIENLMPTGYDVVYNKTTTSEGQSIVVTNILPTKLTVSKAWYDSNGNLITDATSNSALPDKITVEVYQKLLTEEVITGEDVPKPSNFKVVALGDSITLGSYNDIEQQYRYPDRLQAKLQSGGFASASVLNHGVNSNEIDDMRSRLSNIDFNGVNAVLILAGTNDVMHGKSDGAVDRYKQLIEEVFAKAGAAGTENFKIYAATIPYITKLEWFPSGTSQSQANTLVNNFNTGITDLINGDSITIPDGYGIVRVDVNSVVKVIDENGNEVSASETMLKDQCHPNEKGYEEIAKAFYSAILSQYTEAIITTVTNPTDVDLPNADYNINDLASGTLYGTYDITKADGYSLVLRNLPRTDVLGSQYVYYVREVGTHILNGDSYRLSENAYKYIEAVQYDDNGMTALADDSMTIKNTIKTINLNIEKEWSDGNENHESDVITVRIHRDTVADSAAAKQNPLTLTLNKSEITLYKDSTVSSNLTASVPVKPVTDNKVEVVLDLSKQHITLTPKSGVGECNHKITFESEDGQTVELTVHIIEKPELTLVLDKYELNGGETAPVVSGVYTILDENVKSEATYESNNSNVIEIDANTGEMTVKGIGTATITASYDGKTATKVVTVSYSDDFDVASPLNMTENQTIALADNPFGIDPFIGEFSYEITPTNDSPSDGLTISGSTLTASKAGTYTVTVTRGDGKAHDILVNVVKGTKDGTLPLTNSTNQEVTYSYDETKGIITITVPKNTNNYDSSHKFNDIATNVDLKDLIPTKYELILSANTNYVAIYSAGNGWTEYNSTFSAGEAIEMEASGNESFEQRLKNGNSDMGFNCSNDAGPFTLKIYVKTSESGSGGSGNTSQGTIYDVNQLFSSFNQNNYNTGVEIEANSTVTVRLSGTSGQYYKISMGGNTSQSGDWVNLNGDNGYSGNLDSDGTKTIEISIPQKLYYNEIQGWDANGITLVSYTIIPPATANANSVSKAPKLTRFTASSLRMSTAKALAAELDSIPEETQTGITQQEQQSMEEHGYFDRTISDDGNWKITLPELPQYFVKADGTVANYYYWAEEISGAEGYKTSYSFTDADDATSHSINASNSGDATIRIKNTLNQIPSSTTLPESGGSGTCIYYTIGGLLLLLSAAGYTTFKRRRWFNE